MPPLAARSPTPEMQAPPAPPASPERPPMGGVGVVTSGHAVPAAGPPRPPVVRARTRGLGKPGVGGMLLINVRAALAALPATRPPPAPPASPERPPMGGVSVVTSGQLAAHYARSKADLINARSKAKRAVAEATCKAMLGTELGSVAQQPPQAPTATNEDAGRACTQGGDDEDDGEDVFYWFYQQPRKRRPADASSMQARKHDDALPQQQPRKRGRSNGKMERLEAGAALHACAAPSFLQEPLPAVKQSPPPQPSFQPPPSLHPLPRSDLWKIVDMHGLG